MIVKTSTEKYALQFEISLDLPLIHSYSLCINLFCYTYISLRSIE